ncbi:Crp/Fnr family transcriptional regulator [Neptuniibacter sp. CAU 1671]|uniref:Crp/Fnr family transcriptional regulator n=1 Tax=Neptuniibacter sp. CAU 1671 TaxID=3032593 RepID=UPI0023DCE1F0|nr:Crp/Fnr family transcriptional regulator [Neptuniibacter sp. CAU 1671]MDF2181173.1 Crp/Fnr family transcriptional regulator [Neptuniibacter sp. CAU 1671]
MNRPEWLDQFPALKKISQSPHWSQALDQCQLMTLPADTPVFHQGDLCQYFVLVLQGAIRVQKLSANGREIVLYRVESGQSCILTTACMLGNQPYQAEAFTESETRAVAFPVALFRAAMDESSVLREFVFAGYVQRLSELMLLIDQIAFSRMDSRLANYLLLQTESMGGLRLTHQQLARELGSAREVISRLLKEFERQGLVNLQRGLIQICDRPGLEKIAVM